MSNQNNYNGNSEVPFQFKSQLIHAQVEDEALVLKNHQRLIDSATELFSKEGYHTTTIRQIVKHSGIGIGSIYQYVKNKEEILVLILEYILKKYKFNLSSSIEINDPPKERLIIGIETYVRIIDKEYQKIILAYASTNSLSPPYREYIKELELNTNQIFEEILIEGIEQGQFKPINVQLVAYDIIMFAHMWALKRWFFKSIITVDEYIDQQTKHILEMVLKTE
ncbi:TetR/AcrR family transcriptional regulator [Neobacillus sp. OS1-32]|jgi:AcrR family transcriptional regulator|uniref:TetR/AcrR family transcriptional regulator n=1 Tax=Neobacillus sp. OS1-32 TaxID=3070682 RepID=UPI0027DF646C|nr:TetR/AcrR family transcriptional regulator [Neobacillus sp. OS1-32]WML31250.1 TetR/AcrR family transcriptional regulator [Neobacillus sp. OS1-32]